MSLPQLIGMECVACRKSIVSIADGTFCESCGNPVHARCLGAAIDTGIVAGDAPPTSKSPDACPRCGGDAESAIAKEVRRSRGAQTQINERRTDPVDYPVAKTCPNCKSDKFTRERPERWVAFAWDRRCTECGTRYSPPTPTWAAVVFIIAGVLLGGFGGFGVIGALATGNPLSVPAMACQGLFAIVGVLALVHGIRSLANPGKS